MKKQWFVLAALVGWTGVTSIAEAQMIADPWRGPAPSLAYVPNPVAVGGDLGGSVAPGGAMPGYGPGMPPGGMPGYGQPMMPPYGQPGMPVNAPPPGMVPPGAPLPGAGFYPPPPGEGPPLTMVPASLGRPAGFVPFPSCPPLCCPAKHAPGVPGSYTAFTEESPEDRDHNVDYDLSCAHWYVDAGALAYVRQAPNSRTAATFDSSGATAVNFEDYSPSMHPGVRAMIGVTCDWGAIELSGYYLPRVGATLYLVDPGQIDVNFVNPPPGFAGVNGLWHQADQVLYNFRTEMYDAELMYRSRDPELTGLCFLAGVRFWGNQEYLDLSTVENLPAAGQPQNPDLVADYLVRARNEILGPQFGVELNQTFWKYFGFDLAAKYVPGADFVHVDRTLKRGDGLIGLEDEVDKTQFSQLIELDASLDMYLCEFVRLRVGYSVLWVLDVAQADRQVDFNLQSQGQYLSNGSNFYHGPSIELTIKF